MSSTAAAKAVAHDATAQTADDLPADRPPTDAEIAYLRARAEETAGAVKVMEVQMEGWKQSLKDAREQAREAKAAYQAVQP